MQEAITYSERVMSRKRQHAAHIQALRELIEADALVKDGMSAATRARLLSELGKCASSLVLRGNPWPHRVNRSD